MNVVKAFLVIAAAGVLVASSAAAQNLEMSRGEHEYMNSCAACHGAEAKGDGPLAKLLTERVPDLTRIAERNGGVFPIDRVMDIIDGRKQIRAHGDSMPVWGSRYVVEAGDDYGPWGSAAELYVRSRILELAYYLHRIQERDKPASE